MARGKIVLDAEYLAELLQLPAEWPIIALWADSEQGRLTLLVEGDFALPRGQGVPPYRNVAYIQARAARYRDTDDGPWRHVNTWEPEQPPKPKEKQADALSSAEPQ